MGGRVGWLKEAWMGKHLSNRRCFLVFLLLAISLFLIPSTSASEINEIGDYFEYSGINHTIQDYGRAHFYNTSEGYWYVVSEVTTTNSSVFKYYSNWTYTGINYNISSETTDPKDIYFYNGFWYLQGNNTVFKYNPDWSYTGTSYDISGYDSAMRGIYHDDYWYVVGTTDEDVYLFDDSWSYTGTSYDIASIGTAPTDIVKKQGEWWITDYGTDKIYKYYSNWTYSGVNYDVEGSYPYSLYWNKSERVFSILNPYTHDVKDYWGAEIRIYLFDELTNEKIDHSTHSFSITISNETVSVDVPINDSEDAGILKASDIANNSLVSGYYDISISASDHSDRELEHVYLNTYRYNNITGYLLDSTNSTDITFTVWAGDTEVSGAKVTVEKEIDGTYESVAKGLTDDNGRVSAPLKWLDTYRVTASKGGYDDEVKTIEVNAYSFDFYLAEPTDRGEYYPTHHVTFKVITNMGEPLSGVNVTAIGHSDEATFGSLDWFASLLGIDYVGTELHNTTMNGTTDETGTVTFLMVEEIYYSVHFNDSSRDINLTKYYYPREDYYTIIIKEEEETSMAEALNITVTKSTINDTHAYINLTYNDSTELTNHVNTTIYKKADWGEWSNVANHTTTSSNFNHSFIVNDYKGYSYLIEVNISHSLFGDLKRDFATQFKGKLLDLGLPDSVYPWLSFGLLLFLGLLFGRTSVNQGAVICCFSGWMFLWFGWLDIVGNSATIALTLATILAITGVINEWQKQEGVR